MNKAAKIKNLLNSCGMLRGMLAVVIGRTAPLLGVETNAVVIRSFGHRMSSGLRLRHSSLILAYGESLICERNAPRFLICMRKRVSLLV